MTVVERHQVHKALKEADKVPEFEGCIALSVALSLIRRFNGKPPVRLFGEVIGSFLSRSCEQQGRPAHLTLGLSATSICQRH